MLKINSNYNYERDAIVWKGITSFLNLKEDDFFFFFEKIKKRKEKENLYKGIFRETHVVKTN